MHLSRGDAAMDAQEFDESTVRVWSALISDRQCIVSVTALVDLAATDLETVLSSLGSLESGGLVEFDAAAETVTLTPLSADRLGLRVEYEGGAWVWVPVDQPERQSRARSSSFDASTRIDRRQHEPWQEVEAWEYADTLAAAQAKARAHAESMGKRYRRTDAELEAIDDSLPKPGLVLTGVQMWPPQHDNDYDALTRKWAASRRCPVCRGRKLRPSHYCLWCDRWGLDWLLPRIKAPGRSKGEEKARERVQPTKRKRQTAGA